MMVNGFAHTMTMSQNKTNTVSIGCAVTRYTRTHMNGVKEQTRINAWKEEKENRKIDHHTQQIHTRAVLCINIYPSRFFSLVLFCSLTHLLLFFFFLLLWWFYLFWLSQSAFAFALVEESRKLALLLLHCIVRTKCALRVWSLCQM